MKSKRALRFELCKFCKRLSRAFEVTMPTMIPFCLQCFDQWFDSGEKLGPFHRQWREIAPDRYWRIPQRSSPTREGAMLTSGFQWAIGQEIRRNPPSFAVFGFQGRQNARNGIGRVPSKSKKNRLVTHCLLLLFWMKVFSFIIIFCCSTTASTSLRDIWLAFAMALDLQIPPLPLRRRIPESTWRGLCQRGLLLGDGAIHDKSFLPTAKHANGGAMTEDGAAYRIQMLILCQYGNALTTAPFFIWIAVRYISNAPASKPYPKDSRSLDLSCHPQWFLTESRWQEYHHEFPTIARSILGRLKSLLPPSQTTAVTVIGGMVPNFALWALTVQYQVGVTVPEFSSQPKISLLLTVHFKAGAGWGMIPCASFNETVVPKAEVKYKFPRYAHDGN